MVSVTIGLVPTKNLPPSTSEAVDDYLKAILELSGPDEQRVSSNALAGHLGVRAALGDRHAPEAGGAATVFRA